MAVIEMLNPLIHQRKIYAYVYIYNILTEKLANANNTIFVAHDMQNSKLQVAWITI